VAAGRKDRVFLSYASEDLETAKKVYDGLIKRKLDVWFDKKHLKAGRWHPQIIEAIEQSRYFFICLSESSLKKIGHTHPGYQKEELSLALEIARKQPESEFTIVPTRLEDCDRGGYLVSPYQQYDLFDDFDKGLDKLAVNIGGISLSDDTAKDERSDEEKSIDGLYTKATIESYAGRFNESITLLDEVLASRSDHAPAWLTKGFNLAGLGRLEKAVEALDMALQIDPNFVPACVNKGSALGSLGRIREALNAFDKALQINPNDALAWYNMGFALDILGKYEEAIRAFDNALQIKPNNVQTWDRRGVAFARLGKYEEAIEAFDKALEINAKYDDAWHNKGLTLFRLSKHDEALAAFDKALEINPDDPGALKYRDELKKQLKRQ
jgi:tetratricopeptide (TPR) repeat protein